MRQKNREEQKEINSQKKFLGKNKDKVKLCRKVGADFWRMAYNILCRKCQVKIVGNPTMPFDEYCIECQANLKKLARENGLKLR